MLYSVRDGAPSYAHCNARGDVVGRTDAAGNFTWQASYEAFGMRLSETGSTPERQRANTKDEDPTGLLNEHFRYRDLESGTFLSRDPAGFVDGPNLYAYVMQNPWTAFDPLGLNKVVVSGGVCEDPKKDPERHDSNWKHFVKSAEITISAQKTKLKEGEKIEWMVERTTYEKRGKTDGEDYIKQIEKIATDQGVSLRWFSNKDELVKNINTGEDGKARSGAGLISDFQYFGHGNPGNMMTKFYDPTGLVGASDLSAGRIDRNAFMPGCTAKNYGCNGATQQYNKHEDPSPNGQPSFRDAWQAATGVPMSGLVGKSNYAPTAELGNKEWLNSFNPFSGPTRVPTLPIPGSQNWGPDRGKPSYWVPTE